MVHGGVVTLLAGPHYEVVPATGGGGVVTLLAWPHYEVVPTLRFGLRCQGCRADSWQNFPRYKAYAGMLALK